MIKTANLLSGQKRNLYAAAVFASATLYFWAPTSLFALQSLRPNPHQPSHSTPQHSQQQASNRPDSASGGQVVLLKNGNLFRGKVTDNKTSVFIQLDEKTSITIAKNQIHAIAISANHLYEQQSKNLKAWDLKGRQQLFHWCLKEHLYNQADSELQRIANGTIIRKVDLDKLRVTLNQNKSFHLQQLAVAQKQREMKKRQSDNRSQNPKPTYQQLGHQSPSNTGSPKKAASNQSPPVVRSVFQFYGDKGPNTKRSERKTTKTNSIQQKADKSKTGQTKNLLPNKTINQQPPQFPKSSTTETATKPKAEPKKLSPKDAESNMAGLQLRPTPDPAKPYDPKVFNRFYHPERTNTRSKTQPVNYGIELVSLETTSLFKTATPKPKEKQATAPKK